MAEKRMNGYFFYKICIWQNAGDSRLLLLLLYQQHLQLMCYTLYMHKTRNTAHRDKLKRKFLQEANRPYRSPEYHSPFTNLPMSLVSYMHLIEFHFVEEKIIILE